jgi:hypothetical protein
MANAMAHIHSPFVGDPCEVIPARRHFRAAARNPEKQKRAKGPLVALLNPKPRAKSSFRLLALWVAHPVNFRNYGPGGGRIMRNIASGVTTALSLALAPPATAQTPADPAPQWVVDQSGYHCAIATKLGGGPGTMVLRTFAGSDNYALVIASASLTDALVRARKSIGMTPTTGTEQSRAPGEARAKGNLIRFTYLPDIFVDDLEKSTYLSFSSDGKRVAQLSIPGVGKAVRALRRCVTDKLVEAGADPAGFASGARRPKPLGNSFAWIDYPSFGSLHGPSSFYAAILLDVETDGRASACEVLDYKGNVGPKRESACKTLLARARFEPGRTADGKPVKSLYVYEVLVGVVETISTDIF